MTDAVAKAAGVPLEVTRRALMLSGDLTRTAEIAMTTGEEGLREVGFELFRPILPMLASTAESVGDAVAGYERALVEWKLDGIRIQAHRRDDEVRIYTRNLNEITDALPGIAEAVRRLPVRQAVLDGEARMGEHGLPRSRRRSRESIETRHPRSRPSSSISCTSTARICWTRRSTASRPARGAGTGPEDPGLLTSFADEASRVLDEALSAGHEGVVVKDAASLYAAGRRGKSWRKVKPVRPTTSSCSAPSGDTGGEKAGSRTCTSLPAIRRPADS